MGIVSVPITWQPYIMLMFDLFEGGPKGPAVGVTGCMVGYIWWWTVWGRNPSGQGILSPYSRAPEWLRRLMGECGPRVPLGAERSTGGGIYVTAPRQTATSGSATTAGYRWGSGRRLGE
jgi:Derlin-2/3